MKKYNHVCCVYFSIDSEFNGDQTENISAEDLIAALHKRINALEADIENAGEAFHIVESGDME